MVNYLEMPTNQASFPLGSHVKEPAFALMDSAPSYRYDNGKKTDIIEGTKYTVANTRTFDKIDVKTPEKTPIVSAEQIAASDERIFISFVNAIAKPVKIEYGKVYYSVTADSAKIMRKTN